MFQSHIGVVGSSFVPLTALGVIKDEDHPDSEVSNSTNHLQVDGERHNDQVKFTVDEEPSDRMSSV